MNERQVKLRAAMRDAHKHLVSERVKRGWPLWAAKLDIEL